jgi:cellobiose epimerase
VTSFIEKHLIEMENHLQNGIISFWLKRGIDRDHGGYLTCFDAKGLPTGDDMKYIVTQTRMIWGFSAFSRLYPDNPVLLEQAKQGLNFFLKYFWDEKYGGWLWKAKRDGTAVDNGKVIYGQSFAIYALTEYFLATRDPIALEYAEMTFDLIQKYGTDTLRGGYYENLEADWSLSEAGFAGGDRKSLDIHMHLLEAFTTLYGSSKKEIHRRKLIEVIDLIIDKMIDRTTGCGLNQFDLEFNPIPAISIRRTWNAERQTGEVINTLMDVTSYGHNLELSWLLNRAGEVLGLPEDQFHEITQKLVSHSLQYGFDHQLGGVYRDGPHSGSALVCDKEFWQNAEALVGFLDAFEKLGDVRYLEAFKKTWEFAQKYMINQELGEWRQLLDKNGHVLVGNLGNPWKACYHSGRSLLESIHRFKRMVEKSPVNIPLSD